MSRRQKREDLRQIQLNQDEINYLASMAPHHQIYSSTQSMLDTYRTGEYGDLGEARPTEEYLHVAISDVLQYHQEQIDTLLDFLVFRARTQEQVHELFRDIRENIDTMIQGVYNMTNYFQHSPSLHQMGEYDVEINRIGYNSINALIQWLQTLTRQQILYTPTGAEMMDKLLRLITQLEEELLNWVIPFRNTRRAAARYLENDDED